MTISNSYPYVSPEDYLEGEKISPIKHEYRQGRIYAISGTSKAHDAICVNLITLLRNHVRGIGCSLYTSNVKVRIAAANIFYYPDATVTCDPRDQTSPEDYFIRYPCLIIEVLSPTTAAFDRGDKFADYATLETLQEYVLISQSQTIVECFRRDREGNWVSETYEQGQEVSFSSIGFTCAIADVYEAVP